MSYPDIVYNLSAGALRERDARVRAEALEEAAKVCDDMASAELYEEPGWWSQGCAEAIRALKEK